MSRRHGGGFDSDEEVVRSRVCPAARARHMDVAEAGGDAEAAASRDMRHVPVGLDRGRCGSGSASAVIVGRASLPHVQEREQDTHGDAAMSDIPGDHREVHEPGAPPDHAFHVPPGSVPPDVARPSALAHERDEGRGERNPHGAAGSARRVAPLAGEHHLHDAAALSGPHHEPRHSVTGDRDTVGMASMTRDDDGVDNQAHIPTGRLSPVGDERSSDVMELPDGHVRAEDTGGGDAVQEEEAGSDEEEEGAIQKFAAEEPRENEQENGDAALDFYQALEEEEEEAESRDALPLGHSVPQLPGCFQSGDPNGAVNVNDCSNTPPLTAQINEAPAGSASQGVQSSAARAEGDENDVEEKKFSIENCLLLYGMLVRMGCRAMTLEAYESVTKMLALGAECGSFLKSISWRKKNVTNPEDPSVPLSEVNLETKTHILPSRATVTRNMRLVLKHLALPSKLVRLWVDTSKAGAAAVARQSEKTNALRGGGTRRKRSSAEVRIILPSEVVRADVLNATLWEAMNSDESEEEMKASRLINCRSELYGPNLWIDAVRPLSPNFATSLSQGSKVPDGSWRWTYCGIGDVVEVRATRALKPVLRQSPFECESCKTSLETSLGGGKYFFGAREAVGNMDDRSLIGKIAVVWNVGGASSWKDVNRFCKNVTGTSEEAMSSLARRLRDGSVHHDVNEGGEDILASFQYKVDRNASNNSILLALLLSRAAEGRSYKNNDDTASSRKKLILPWTPVKAGDTVAMVPLPRDDTSFCPCSCSTRSTNSCILVINRWWREGKEHTRQVTYVPDIADAIKKISESAAAAGREDDCPFGSRAQRGRYAGLVVKNPVVDSRGEDSVGSTSARVTAVWIRPQAPDTATAPGADDFGGRSGHFTAAMRRRMRESAPSSGFMKNKKGAIVPYFTYRAYAYHDGFTKETHRQTSVTGVYWGCLNLPASRRQCAGHVRCVTLCPPGTDVKAVYRVMLEDILKSAVHGIKCVTPDGKDIIVFIDLVCILGDTPAINELLDVGGQSSGSPCHLCNYKHESEKGKGIRGGAKDEASKNRTRARFSDRTTYAALRTNGRSMHRQQAVRVALCGRAKSVHPRDFVDEAGMCADIEDTAHEDEKQGIVSSVWPLHDHARSYERAALTGRLPQDLDGRPILPPYFCPYRACVPVPEHLLCGVFVDAVNLALSSFRRPDEVKAVNQYFHAYQEACGIVIQSQTVNANKPVLNSMSMSDQYGLSLVAERGLRAVASNPNRSPLDKPEDEEGLKKAIELVGSAAALIAAFWTAPEPTDPDRDVFAEEFAELVSCHLKRIDDLCKKPGTQARGPPGSRSRADAGTNSLLPSGTRLGRRHARSVYTVPDAEEGDSSKKKPKTHDHLARKFCDVPNTHRLMELGASFVHFVQWGHLIAELVFEMKHQPMKRLLEKFTGQMRPHIFAVEWELLNDYKRRLCSLYEGAIRHNPVTEVVAKYVRGLVPLLLGRGRAQAGAGTIDDDTILQVRNVIGVQNFVPDYFKTNFQSLMTPRRSDRSARGCAVGTERYVWKACNKNDRTKCGKCLSCAQNKSCSGESKSVLSKHIVKEIVAANAKYFPQHTLHEWPEKLKLSLDDDKCAECFTTGQHQFLRKTVIGSVLSCSVSDSRLHDNSNPFINVAGASTDSLPTTAVHAELQTETDNEQHADASRDEHVRYFCVNDLYTMLDDSPAEQGARSDSEDGQLNGNYNPFRDCVIVAVVTEVMDDTSGSHASRETTLPKTQLKVNNAPVFGPANTGCCNLSPYRLLRMDGGEGAGIRPVAALTVCENNSECYASHDEGAARTRIVHDSECGPRKGGCFVIRDRRSGFPHRSA